MIHDTEATAPVNPAEVCCDHFEPMPCLRCAVPPEVRERDNIAAWQAVSEGRAMFVVDCPRPGDEHYEPSGPYRDDLDDFCPTAAEDEWNAQRAAETEFRAFLHDEADRLRYVVESRFGEWLAGKIEALARVARTLDAKDGAEFDDRLATLDEQYA